MTNRYGIGRLFSCSVKNSMAESVKKSKISPVKTMRSAQSGCAEISPTSLRNRSAVVTPSMVK